MKQLQFYKYSAAGLLVLNLAMVAFFFLTAPPHQGGRADGQRAVDILKLDRQQDESFMPLAREHMQLMDDFNDQQRSLLKPYFNSLVEQNDTYNSDSLLHQVQLIERKKIESTYQHFQDVKALLRPEQEARFAAFVDHALQRILLEQSNQGPPLPMRK